MKSTLLAFGLALSLSQAAVAAGHGSFGFHGHSGEASFGGHGGHWHGGFAPGLALGFGLGTLWSYPWYSWDYPIYSYGYAYPAYSYSYAPSAYAYSSAPAVPAPQLAQAAQAPTSSETPAWNPSSPGAGTWVPDPQPYSYRAPQSPVHASGSNGHAQTVTVTKTPGTPPVYAIRH